MKVYKIRNLRTGRFARRTGNSFGITGCSWDSLKKCTDVFRLMCTSETERGFLEIVQYELVETEKNLGWEDLFVQAQDSYQSMHDKKWYSKVENNSTFNKTIKDFDKD